ncbi:kinesin-like protein KIF11 [Portunus trituberculatus]|uniref:kinesin-like protein KIF11 n=1 Tax=Portunus trituberculatus TaxID=210409 RepID=UPI001E1CE728|nr:kinesin-like protein KIF11 [Portunus trituberculatus]
MMSSPVPVRRRNKANASQNIKVFVRCRPMNTQERAGKSHNIVTVQNSREVVVKERPTDKFAKTFTFDHVFGQDSKQIDVYKAVAKNSVEEVLNGFNCTIFAYGQTGTGKTFTMEGERVPDATTWEEDPLAGIIPRCVNHLFDELRMQKVEFTMRVSFLELYNEELFDLLSAHDDFSKLRLYEDSSKKGSCIIQGLEEVLVRSKSDVYSILEKGSMQRQTAATLMNAHSSRSHTVFTVTVHMKENTVDGDELMKTGKLHLVDLAGSENIGRSGAVEKRAREAGNINMSLLTLGRVITALVEKAPHIPYRESKLTRLLQDALGGRTKTSVIATISPASINQEETLSTLDYAHRAKNIQNKPEVNQKLHKKELIQEYSQEIERLRLDLLAMREKSGVYLANENYQEMQNTMEAQATEITEKIAHIRTLEAELEKKLQLFKEVSQQLQDTSKELANTKDTLSDTQNTLSCTQRLLHTTAQEREEQRYLVSAHARTEERLQVKGQTLIDTAATTTSDLSRLHDKLDRKLSVDSQNTQLFEEFQASYAEIQASLRDTLQSSLSQHIDRLSQANRVHAKSLAECQSAVSESGRAVGALADTHATLATSALVLQNKLVEVVQWSVRGAREESQDIINQQRDLLLALLNTTTQITGQMATLISSATTNITALNSSVSAKLQEMEGLCEGLQQHHASVSADVLREVETHNASLLQHTQDAAAAVQSLLNSQDTQSKSINTDLDTVIAMLTSMKGKMGDLTSSNQQQAITAQNSMSLVQGEAGQAVGRVKTMVQEGTQHGSSLLAQVHTQTSAAVSQVEDCVGELEVTLQRLGEKRCEMETGMQQYSSQAQQSVEAATALQDRQVTELEKKMDTHLKEAEKEIKAGETTMTTALTQGSHTLQEEAGRLEGAREELSGEVQAVEEGLRRLCEEMDSSQRVQSEMVKALFTEDMRHDLPTGQTPVRREYVFPSSLPATSPHDRLLQRFRASLLSSSKIPLPSFGDDLEDDASETSTASSDSPVNPEEQPSEDKTDDQTFLPPRPALQREDSGIPLSLSRSSSVSSITDGKENVRGTSRLNNSTTITTTKKREIKPPSVFKSASMEKLAHTTTTTTSDGRTRRILGTQN